MKMNQPGMHENIPTLICNASMLALALSLSVTDDELWQKNARVRDRQTERKRERLSSFHMTGIAVAVI